MALSLSRFIDAISINNVTATKTLTTPTEPTEPTESDADDIKTDVRRNVHLSTQTCSDLIHFSNKLNTNQSKLIRTILNHVFAGWKQQPIGDIK